MSDYPNYGSLDGPVIMIGFGSIGRGTLPLILRHFDVKPEQITVVAPGDANAAILARYGVQKLAPYQSVTGLQVASAVLAGMVWAVENADIRPGRRGAVAGRVQQSCGRTEACHHDPGGPVMPSSGSSGERRSAVGRPPGYSCLTFSATAMAISTCWRRLAA